MTEAQLIACWALKNADILEGYSVLNVVEAAQELKSLGRLTVEHLGTISPEVYRDWHTRQFPTVVVSTGGANA